MLIEDRLQAVVGEFSRNKAEHEHVDPETASDQEEKGNKPDRSTKLRVKTQYPSDPDGDEDPSSSDDEDPSRSTKKEEIDLTAATTESSNKDFVCEYCSRQAIRMLSNDSNRQNAGLGRKEHPPGLRRSPRAVCTALAAYQRSTPMMSKSFHGGTHCMASDGRYVR